MSRLCLKLMPMGQSEAPPWVGAANSDVALKGRNALRWSVCRSITFDIVDRSPVQKKTLISRGFLDSKRMGRDSNPRYSHPYSGFQDRCIKPLCHPSNQSNHWFFIFFQLVLLLLCQNLVLAFAMVLATQNRG